MRRSGSSRRRWHHLASRSIGAEEAVPTQQARPARQAGTPQRRPVLRLVQKQLANAQPRLEPAHRPKRRNDRQRHDDRPRPRTDRVQIDREPLGQQHDLRRNRRALLVGNLPQQGQIEPRETVDRVGPAVGQNGLAGTAHVLGARVVAGQLQGEIRLDASADLDAAAGIHRPAALGKLLLDDVGGAAAGQLGIFVAEERHQQDRFALQDGVAFQFGAPRAVGVLLGQAATAASGGSPGGPASPSDFTASRGLRRDDFLGIVLPIQRRDASLLARTHGIRLQASDAILPDLAALKNGAGENAPIYAIDAPPTRAVAPVVGQQCVAAMPPISGSRFPQVTPLLYSPETALLRVPARVIATGRTRVLASANGLEIEAESFSEFSQ